MNVAHALQTQRDPLVNHQKSHYLIMLTGLHIKDYIFWVQKSKEKSRFLFQVWMKNFQAEETDWKRTTNNCSTVSFALIGSSKQLRHSVDLNILMISWGEGVQGFFPCTININYIPWSDFQTLIF